MTMSTPESSPARKSVLSIAGSLRRNSYNRHLLRAAAQVPLDGMQFALYERLEQVPPFDEDHEQRTADGVRHLRDAVRGADGLLIATPEYNQSIPGVLKNVIDWLSRDESLLRAKPVAVIGATMGSWGTRLAQAALRQTLTATGARVMPEPMLFVAHANECFDANGRLHDAAVASRLHEVVKDFRHWILVNDFHALA
jgi:chromate reductase, NAD(P)H dehydrogenase (quinone)